MKWFLGILIVILVAYGAMHQGHFQLAPPQTAKPEQKKPVSKVGAMKVDPLDRNEANRKLMALGEEDRRKALYIHLAMSGERCAEVTRTFYQGSAKPSWNAIWNVECRGGPSYVIQVQSDEVGSTKVLTCGQLRAMGGGECFRKYER